MTAVKLLPVLHYSVLIFSSPLHWALWISHFMGVAKYNVHCIYYEMIYLINSSDDLAN